MLAFMPWGRLESLLPPETEQRALTFQKGQELSGTGARGSSQSVPSLRKHARCSGPS